MSQISESDRAKFLAYIRVRLNWGAGCREDRSSIFPKWDGLISELPLAVEFLARSGGKEELFAALEEKDISVIPGHVLLLMQIEDLIALNYTVFTESEYMRLDSVVRRFRITADAFLRKFDRKGPGNTTRVTGYLHYKGVGDVSALRLQREITEACNGISEECRKARYLFLKGALTKGVNVEVNQDKDKVEGYLRRFGFAPLLASSLNEADRLYQDDATAFDLKSCVGHLRSFLEILQSEAMPGVHAKYGGALPKTWGSGLAYLSQNGVLSKTEEQFAAHFYTLISDEGVHPLIAEKEYARLARNMVIEYALLFLTKLDKLGLGSVRKAGA